MEIDFVSRLSFDLRVLSVFLTLEAAKEDLCVWSFATVLGVSGAHPPG